MNSQNRKTPETEEDVFNIFLELFNAVAPEIPEEIDKFLIENGYDPSELAQNAGSIFKEDFENSPLDWKNRARQEMKDAKSKLSQYVPKAGRMRQEVIAEIILIQRQQGFAAHFRNLDLDNVSYEDLESMLMNLQHLNDSQSDE